MACVLLAAGVGAAAPASASSQKGLRVVIDGGDPVLVAKGDLAPRDEERIVTIRGQDGDQHTERVGGATAATVLGVLRLAPEQVASLTVLRNDGSSVTLSSDELTNGFTGDPRYPGASIPATFDGEYNDTNARFFRPLRGPEDDNATDDVNPGIDQDLRLVIKTKNGTRKLAVSAQALPSKPKVGETVAFSARVEGGGDLRYFWDFGDGGPRTQTTQPEVTHAYAAAGSFQPTVSVLAPGGSGGADSTVRIEVGTPVDGGTASTPTPPAPAPAAGSGGSGSGGGDAPSGGGTGAPGAAETGPRRGKTQGSGIPRPASGRRASRSQKQKQPETRSSTARRASTTAPAGGTPSTDGAAPEAAQPTRAAPASKTRPAPAAPRARSSRADPAAATRRPGRRRPGAGPEISGTLVAGAGDDITAALAAADAIAPPDAPPAAARAAAGGSLPGVLQGVTGAVSVLLLLAIGGAREGLRLSLGPA